MGSPIACYLYAKVWVPATNMKWTMFHWHTWCKYSLLFSVSLKTLWRPNRIIKDCSIPVTRVSQEKYFKMPSLLDMDYHPLTLWGWGVGSTFSYQPTWVESTTLQQPYHQHLIKVFGATKSVFTNHYLWDKSTEDVDGFHHFRPVFAPQTLAYTTCQRPHWWWHQDQWTASEMFAYLTGAGLFVFTYSHLIKLLHWL